MKIGREIKREGEKRIWREREKEEKKNRGGEKGLLYTFILFFFNVLTLFQTTKNFVLENEFTKKEVRV